MSDEISRISELTNADTIKESGVLPLVNNPEEATVKVDISTLRAAMFFEHAFEDVTTGLSQTSKGDPFFAFESPDKETVLGWINQGGGTYSTLLDKEGVQAKHVTGKRMLDLSSLYESLLSNGGEAINVKVPGSNFSQTINNFLGNNVYNIADFGASPLKSGAQNHLIISAVELLAKATGGKVLVPQGVFKRAGDTIMDGRFALCGVFNGIQNHGDTQGSVIKYVGNYGTKVTVSSKVLIEDLAFQQEGGTDAIGIDLQAAGRSNLSRVTVDGFAGHGINAVNGNMSSYQNIICLNNGGDGFRLSGLSTPDINCCSLINIDSRGNTGAGINLDNAWNVFGLGLIAQSNKGFGLIVNNCRQSFIIFYAENNVAGSAKYTSHANNEGNYIIESFVDVTSIDESKGENIVFKSKTGADTYASFEKMVNKSILFPNLTNLGTLLIKHTADARFDFYVGATAQKQTIRWKNVAGLTTPDTDEPVYPLVHDLYGSVLSRRRAILTVNSATPSVDLSEFFLANNTAATTITSFSGGQDGQVVYIVFNNANTTLKHSATNSGIRLKSGADKTYAQYEGASFIKNGANWWIEV